MIGSASRAARLVVLVLALSACDSPSNAARSGPVVDGDGQDRQGGNAAVPGAAPGDTPTGNGPGQAPDEPPGQTPTTGEDGAAGTGSPTAPPGTAPGSWGSWSSYGGDLAHSRAAAGETRISTANVGELKTAFVIDAPGVTAEPAVRDGVVYWSDWGGIVHATDVLTQQELWRVDNSADWGGYTGSPAVTETTVYVANRNGLLSAIDRASGESQWTAALDAGPHTHIWSSPIVVEQDGVLIIGVAGVGTRDNGRALPRSQIETFRGAVEGYDMNTGQPLWTFETSANHGAGVSVWSSAAVDVERKLAFIGTGNNYYDPVSPYSDSLLAINYVSGELVWHHQFTEDDAWTVGTTLGGGVDGDVGATPNLFSIGERDVVGVGDKPGDYHVLDRETGTLVWETRLTSGGFQGGVMAPAAYHEGTIYVVSNNGFTNSTVFALDAATGAERWSTNMRATTFGGPVYGNGVLFAGDQDGNVLALDAQSGQTLWDTRLPQGRGGGFSLVDGMLLTGFGFHFSESDREPLQGGLLAYSLAGTLEDPTVAEDTSDCDDSYVPTAVPTFTNVYQEVICGTGCWACHGPAMQGALGLEPKANAYANLVGRAAGGEPCAPDGQMLVAPGDANASLLYTKLAATTSCGDAMPPGDPANSPITPAMLQRVQAWINAGAPDD